GYRAGFYRGYGYGAYGYGYNYNYGVTNTTNANNGTSGSNSSLPSGSLNSLPAGAAPVVIFGKTYYFANGNYYAPKIYAGRTIYVVSDP
ncbi:MAG: hypothetical protein ABI680_14570, partial [Chthoniobacteraceae bacterium]